MSEELKPCPFCGDSAFFYPDGDKEGHSVMCRGVADPSCALNTFGYATEAEAIAAWNTRPVERPQPEPCPFCKAEWRMAWNARPADPQPEACVSVWEVEPEPVAWLYTNPADGFEHVSLKRMVLPDGYEERPLYFHP